MIAFQSLLNTMMLADSLALVCSEYIAFAYSHLFPHLPVLSGVSLASKAVLRSLSYLLHLQHLLSTLLLGLASSSALGLFLFNTGISLLPSWKFCCSRRVLFYVCPTDFMHSKGTVTGHPLG